MSLLLLAIAVCVAGLGISLVITCIQKLLAPQKVKPILCPNCNSANLFTSSSSHILCRKCGKEWGYDFDNTLEEIHCDIAQKIRIYGKLCNPFIDEWRAREEIKKSWTFLQEAEEPINQLN